MGKILVVDDTKFMRQTLSSILTNNGHEVIGEAENGEKAVELYEKFRPDLVTMDITMPVLNGIEAARRILAKDPDASIIMCSAIGQQKIVVEAIQIGAKDFIVKPFDEMQVLTTVNKILFN